MSYSDVSHWRCLGEGAEEVQYRKFDVYDMLWQDEGINIDDFRVVGSPFGGPVALLPDKTKFIPLKKFGTDNNFLRIYTSAGKQISKVPWEKNEVVVKLGWTSQEQLVVVLEDGLVELYSIYGERLLTFSLFEMNNSPGLTIVEAKIWGTGIVALTADLRLVLIDNFKSPLPIFLSDNADPVHSLQHMLGGEMPTAISVLEEQFTGGGTEIFVATTECSIIVVTSDGKIEDQKLHAKLSAPIVDMVVAPNGRFVACFTAQGVLSVLSTSFKKKVLDFNTKSTRCPSQVAYSVVLHLGILMVGPFGDWLKYSNKYSQLSLDSVALPSKTLQKESPNQNPSPNGIPLHLIQEVDCVRIISNLKLSILQRLPAPLEDVRKIGSIFPGALLYDAMNAFLATDAKADDNIRDIKANGSLPHAVETCTMAALSEFCVSDQKCLLRAATYGKSFCGRAIDSMKLSEKFVASCKKLRVLNAIRDPDGAEEVVVNRIVNRNLHFLALKLCDYLNLKKNRVLVHWASAKVRCSPTMSDIDLCNAVREKLSKVSINSSSSEDMGSSSTNPMGATMNFAQVAAVAESTGRRSLATMLLEYEPKASNQVPMLLSMHQEQLALEKATKSGDSDLIYLTLLHIKKNVASEGRNPKEFFKLISLATSQVLETYQNHLVSKPSGPLDLVGFVSGPSAIHPVHKIISAPIDLLVKYCKVQDKSLLKQLYYYNKRYCDCGLLTIQDAYASTDIKNRLKAMKVASGMFYTGHKEGDKGLGFLWKATEEQMKLLVIQQDLEQITGESYFIDMSVCETIYNCIVLSQHTKAVTIKNTFAVPDKRFWKLKVKALAECEDWKMLQSFSNEKRPPIGFRPFADACLKKGNTREAAKYIHRVKDVTSRLELFSESGYWSEAADICVKLKDEGAFIDLIKTCEHKGNDVSLARLKDTFAKIFTR